MHILLVRAVSNLWTKYVQVVRMALKKLLQKWKKGKKWRNLVMIHSCKMRGYEKAKQHTPMRRT